MRKMNFQTAISPYFVIFIVFICFFQSCEYFIACDTRKTYEGSTDYFQLKDLTYEKKVGDKRKLQFKLNPEYHRIGPICTSHTIDISVDFVLKNTMQQDPPIVKVFWYYQAPKPSKKELWQFFECDFEYLDDELEINFLRTHISLPRNSPDNYDFTYIYLGLELVFTSHGELTEDMTYIWDNFNSWKYSVEYTY